MKTQFKSTILKNLVVGESITVPVNEIWKVDYCGSIDVTISGKKSTIIPLQGDIPISGGTIIKANSSKAVIFGIIFTEVL